MMSVVPPAVKATTIFTGLAGYCCAGAGHAAIAASAASIRNPFMYSPRDESAIYRKNRTDPNAGNMSAEASARFIDLLEQGPADAPCVFNPWRDSDERDRNPRRDMPRLRRENMAAYLDARRTHARVLLLGEAPSHRGCRFSGIAFCSETELTQKAGLVARRTLELTSRLAEEKPQRERSAAVIWSEIERAGKPFEVVLWNAFPWHPYLEDDGTKAGPCGPSSNRKPRTPEVAQGRLVLEALMRCFTRRLEVFAVGKVAEEALARWESVECAGYIRHPAQGGESRFRAQFRSLVAARL